jgi:anti-anti-sigma factor
MEIKSNVQGNEVLLKASGRVDTTNYNDFEKSVNELLADNIKQLIIDCSEINYISSSGLRVFLTIQKTMMSRGGKFSLFAMQQGIKEIFDISGFSSIFSIYPDIESLRK